MNERIEKLALQAGATLERGYIELSDGQLMLSDNVDLDKSNMDLGKFAQLIIRECAKNAVLFADSITVQGLPTKYIENYMLKHFGVEK